MKAPAPPRSPWQLFYGGVHALRRRWFRDRARVLPRPVVSIGNLHWGGPEWKWMFVPASTSLYRFTTKVAGRREPFMTA